MCRWGEGGHGGIATGERKGTYSSGRMEDAWKTREPVLLPSCGANPSGQCGSSIMQFPLKELQGEAQRRIPFCSCLNTEF